ncbi:MAG TPA: M1 family metallopeptidase [Flavipsychrobacter sp.]|nr:M1 family metallopeptidase [Flavipsychrobacter sp.]
MKNSICFLLACRLTFSLSAQTAYWQQEVNTKIEVTLDDEKHLLHGFETIIYKNNSPDTLRYIYLHLWPNAYKHDHTPFAEQQYQNKKTEFYYAKKSQRGYIDSLDFEVEGNDLNYYSAEATPDIARLDLIKPLLPGQQITITTSFRVKIPKVFSRLGHTKQAYFISQWFPKPAVYDKKGWHPIPYLDIGEFYSEYGSYDVSITLPKNYVVMATGNLLDGEENQWLDSLAAIDWYDSSSIKKKLAMNDSIPPSSTEFKTLHFHEDQVHDFAWFADKRYIVRKDSFSYDTAGNNPITIYTAFLPSYKNSWRRGTQHLKNALKIYGEGVGQYPYKTIKAVQGDMNAGGGMEYPTVTVIDKAVGGSKEVIVHEAGHNWFYGILGSNERDHAWMDEGINTFYEQRTMKETRDSSKRQDATKKKKKGVSFDVDLNTTVIAQLAASGKDQAIAQTSKNFSEINYGMDVYYKTAWFLRWMEEYMGRQRFDKGMQDYFNTWKFRHPYPEDFRAVMERNTDKPLDWFFRDLLSTDSRIDFALKKVHTQNGWTTVAVKNKTGLSLPVIISTSAEDSTTSSVVSLPFKKDTILTFPAKAEWKSVRISPAVADMKSQNNFRHAGLQLRPFAGFNNTGKQKVFWLPAVGYNVYDGFGAGLVLHNITMPENKFRFIVAPLYSFRSKSFNGAGSVAYVTHPKNNFEEVTVQLDAKSFHYNESGVNMSKLLFVRYTKVAPSLRLILKEPKANSPVTRNIMLKGYGIQEEYFNYVQDPVDSLFRPEKKNEQLYYGLLRYSHRNDRTFNPFNYTGELQAGKNFMKLTAEANIRIDYHIKNKSLYVRAFAGKFFHVNNPASFNNDRYYLNSTFSGVNDYLYDDTYIGRNEREGLASQQVSMREGGLKIPTPFLASPLGRNDNWLAAINLKSDLPVKLPIRLFLDVAVFADASKLNPSGDKILFDGGVEFHIKDMVNLYIPLVMSRDFKDYFNTIVVKNKFMRSITFSIQLDKINWLHSSSEVFKLAGY